MLVLLPVAWLGVRGLYALYRLHGARSDLNAAKTALLDRRLGDADRLIRSAGHDTRSAKGLTSDPIWRAVAAVPLVGSSLDAVTEVTRTADQVARFVLPPAFEAARSLDPKRLRAPDGAIDLTVLEKAAPAVDRALAAASTAEAGLPALQRSGVIGPVRSASTEVAGQVRDLVTALTGVKRGIRLAPALLGSDRPRRYFVLIQQSSEARGTGGLTGGFAILTADGGRLKVTTQGSNADLREEALPPPPGVPKDYIGLYAGDGAFGLWLNVNLSPDLPVVARVIADRWRRQSGQTIDGVVALDSQALADILRGTPPIKAANGRVLTSDNLVDYLAVGQYRDFATPPGGSGGVDQSPARKQLLTDIAKAATGPLVNGGGSTLQLLRGLSEAVSSGHLRMASDDPALAPGLREAGIDGALPTGDAPVAYPSIFNSSGGKLEYFLDRSLRYQAGSCDGPRRQSTITLDLTNRAPAGLPAYLYNPFNLPGITPTGDRVTVAVYGTRGARLVRATLNGKPLGTKPEVTGSVLVSSEAGLPRWATRLDLPSGDRQRLVLSVDEPTAAGSVRIPHQPLPRPLDVSVDAPAC